MSENDSMNLRDAMRKNGVEISESVMRVSDREEGS